MCRAEQSSITLAANEAGEHWATIRAHVSGSISHLVSTPSRPMRFGEGPSISNTRDRNLHDAPAGSHAADLRSYDEPVRARARGGPLDRCIGEGMKMRRGRAAFAFRGSWRVVLGRGRGRGGEGLEGCVGLVRRAACLSSLGRAFSASFPCTTLAREVRRVREIPADFPTTPPV